MIEEAKDRNPPPRKRVYHLLTPDGGSSDFYWHNSRAFAALERKVSDLAAMAGETGDIPDSEIFAMKRHIESSKACQQHFPGIFLIKWLRAIVKGNVLDASLRPQFLQAILTVAAGPCYYEEETAESKYKLVKNEDGSVMLQLEEPLREDPQFDYPQTIDFKDRYFCFTGKFASGTRSECEAKVTERFGKLSRRPVLSTDYLIIGSLGGYGGKVEEVGDLKKRGSLVRIVTEEHWLKFL